MLYLDQDELITQSWPFGLALHTTKLSYLLFQEGLPTKYALFVSFSFGEEVNGQTITAVSLFLESREV